MNEEDRSVERGFNHLLLRTPVEDATLEITT
jgi:hypothetical protein